MAPESDSGGTSGAMISSRPLRPARASASRWGVAAASNGVRSPSAAIGRSPPPHSATITTRPGVPGASVSTGGLVAEACIDSVLLDDGGHGRRYERRPVTTGTDRMADPGAADGFFLAPPQDLGGHSVAAQAAYLLIA